MESDNNDFKTGLLDENVNLATIRKRNKKLILVFKLFFISLTLIIAALIFYLAQDNTSDSYQTIPLNPPAQTNNPMIITKSQIFSLSLQRAAEELEDVTSLVISNYPANTEFENCLKAMQNGSGQIRDALHVMESNPDSETPSDEHRVEMMTRIIAAEESVGSCLDDLRKAESTAAGEVRGKVLQAEFYLRSRGDFLDGDGFFWRRLWSSDLIAAVFRVVYQNMFVVCICGLQLLFVYYLFWHLFKFR